MPILLIAVIAVVVVGGVAALTVPAITGADDAPPPISAEAPIDSTHQAPELPEGYELAPVGSEDPYVDPYRSYPSVEEARQNEARGDTARERITPEDLFGPEPEPERPHESDAQTDPVEEGVVGDEALAPADTAGGAAGRLGGLW